MFFVIKMCGENDNVHEVHTGQFDQKDKHHSNVVMSMCDEEEVVPAFSICEFELLPPLNFGLSCQIFPVACSAEPRIHHHHSC